MTATDYHRGERTAQDRAGQLDHARRSGRAIRGEMPDKAREFLVAQPMLVVGAADRRGRIWASLLTGEPGFVRAPEPSAVTVAARPVPGDPLAEVLGEAAARPVRVGMIAIEPASRRRMRMNGRAAPGDAGLRVELDQVYANCPKYIQQREPYVAAPRPPAAPVRGTALTAAQQGRIRRADTFFVATADEEGNTDASHRGGNRGFVEVLSPTRLRWPDYAGNAMFNTLGNIEVNPAVGLLVPDWSTGGTLQLTGTARVDWDAEHAAAVPGAERLVEFTVTEVVEIVDATPHRWTAPVFSRFNPTLTAEKQPYRDEQPRRTPEP
jgi:predicted pyridoxine 5'-phosphate oxidase superfamily flavin-nucleotide-binding protein